MNTKAIDQHTLATFSLLGFVKNFLIFAGLALFSTSLFLPTFFTSANDIYGYWVLFIGWMGLVFMQLAWYANPLSLLALLLSHERPKIAFFISCLSVAFAYEAFIFSEIPTGINFEKVYIRELGLGCYIWFSSHLLIAIGLLLRMLASFKAAHTKAH